MIDAQRLRSLVSLALPIGLLTLIPAVGQQPSSPAAPAQPSIKDQGPPKEDDPTGIRAKMHQELREHPRIARSIVELHETKAYLEKAPHDFGGHRVEAIKSVDESIKQLKEALKYDAQHDDKGRHHGDPDKK
jgi:hypothetical protein